MNPRMEMRYLNRAAVLFLICFVLLFPLQGNSDNEFSASYTSDYSLKDPLGTAPKMIGTDSSIEISSEKNGEKTLTLDLRGIDLVELFKILSQKLGKNLIPSKNVAGRVNLLLNDIEYSNVLDIIMITQGLAYEEIGNNVMIIMTEAEYESQYGKKFDEKREIITLNLSHAEPKTVFTALTNLKSNVGEIIVDEVTGTMILIDVPEKLEVMKKAFNDLDKPAVTEAFELQYAKAVEIEDQIKKLATEGSGSVLVDERTNTIIVTDLPGNIRTIMRAIQALDQETRQVFIEAAIVELTLTDDLAYGIEWQKIMNDPSLWGSILTGSFVGTGLTSAYTRLTLGTLQEHKFTATLNFLNTLGDVRILSEPRISVTNNEEATIHVGKREAIVTGTTSQSGESTIVSDSVEFVDIGIKLTVVPTINRDGFITMKIKPEISSVSETVTTGSEDEPRSIIPIITTSEAETTVKVKDGTMIMIAGLKKNESRKTVKGVPYLDKIPILGALFSNRDSQRGQEEIVVFITPHITRGDAMMSWDLNHLKKFPEPVHPENREYFDPEFKVNTLRKIR